MFAISCIYGSLKKFENILSLIPKCINHFATWLYEENRFTLVMVKSKKIITSEPIREGVKQKANVLQQVEKEQQQCATEEKHIQTEIDTTWK
jgi:hypothetical protein